jgi:hypothetical protein
MRVEKLTMWVEKLATWAGKNKGTVYSFECVLHAFVGLCIMFVAYQIGHKHICLLQDGVRTQGRIAEYKDEVFITTVTNFSNTSTRQGMISLPIVEFRIEDRVIRFKDWIGRESRYVATGIVPVIYSSGDPSIAMVDRPILNWMPWAPVFIAGLFLALVSVKNWLRGSL